MGVWQILDVNCGYCVHNPTFFNARLTKAGQSKALALTEIVPVNESFTPLRLRRSVR